ncbi:MAG: hypothetical protein HY431_03070 [Candidatus Levybacteria bacterium]|nr:hypothetical protein [Candidatus Levybacteria bacterium]
MENIRRFLRRTRRTIQHVPHKKQYIEFVTALLSIPVLLTVIILNYNNLKASDDKKQETETKPIIVTIPVEKESPEKEEPTPFPTQRVCKKEIGPVSITSPEEGEVVTDSPVTLSLSHDDDTYCSVVWSYRVNGGKWSDYDDKTVALYNPPKGQVKIEMRVKSTVSKEEKRLTRTFTYQPEETPPPAGGPSNTPTPTNTLQ